MSLTKRRCGKLNAMALRPLRLTQSLYLVDTVRQAEPWPAASTSHRQSVTPGRSHADDVGILKTLSLLLFLFEIRPRAGRGQSTGRPRVVRTSRTGCSMRRRRTGRIRIRTGLSQTY